MATTREFFERVVAWPGLNSPGFINAHWTSPKGPGVRGRPFKEVDAFVRFIENAAKHPETYKDIYFCTSTQAKTKTIKGDNGDFVVAARHANDALFLKAIWLDVDVKPEKGYANTEEMLDAVLAFAKEAKLPFPSAIVYSGSGGAHFYWVNETSLTPEEWRPYAEGLKSAGIRASLRFDAGVTSDAARILRVPGTFNWKDIKNPGPVTVGHLGDCYDFAKDLGILRITAPHPKRSDTATVSTSTPAALTGFEGGPDPAFAGLDPTAGVTKTDFLLEPDKVLEKCLSLRQSALTQGAEDGQGLWALNLLATTFMKNGRDVAHFLSKGYPKYSEEETNAKYDEKVRYKTESKVGWPSCKAFEAEGAPCKDCPFKGKVKSPLNLADRALNKAIHEPVSHPSGDPTNSLDLPPGYELDEHGWISKKAFKKVPGGHGADAEYLVPLFMCKLRNFTLQAGDRKILFECSLDAGRWGQCALSENDLASEQKTYSALRRDGVKPYPENQGRIIQFMTSFSSKIDNAKRRIQTLPFGWLRDEDTQEIQGFAYGGRVVLRGGKTQIAGYADRQLKDWYEPKGVVDPWLEALKLVTDQHHPPLEAVIAASFGAPLMVFMNKYSSTMFNWSPESGAHKSTSMHIGLAVWGMPQMTKESPMSSLKGVIHKLGYIRHLPVFWDEIDTDEKLDDVRKILSVATEGSGGSLLHQDRTFRERDAWQTIMIVAANRSLIGNIQRNVKDTDAKMQRVFEFIVPKKGDTARESEVSKLIGSLDQNYGQMGLRWQEILGSDPDGVKEQVEKVNKQFEHETAHTSPERFRMAMMVCIYVGAQYANTFGATFNLDELWVWLKQQYAHQRATITESETIGGTKPNTANALTEFFKENVRHALWVETFLPGTKGVAPTLTYKAGPTRDRPARIDIRLRIDDRLIEISKGKLTEYLARAKHNPTAVLNGLKTHFDMEIEDKVNLAAGSGILGGREKILKIPVPLGSPLQPLLFMHTPPEMRPEGVVIEEDDEGTAPITEEVEGGRNVQA